MSVVKVAFIGAGNVNFGGPEGPWDHATRLEKYAANNPSTKFIVTAIVDVDTTRATQALTQRKNNPTYAHMYERTEVHNNIDTILQKPDSDISPDVAFIGLPPLYHGAAVAPYDMEIKLANAGVHLFVEKPLSCHPLEQVQKVSEVLTNAKARNGGKLVVSVGYMLRYSSAVKKMVEILNSHGGKVVSTVARYNCAYNSILKGSWWDKTQSGGPVVEQGTHFCDLSRFFGGEIDLSTLSSVCVGATEEVGKLKAIRIDENSILEKNRIPRATSAIWKYKSGAIGSLNHALLLQGYRYHSEFEVWGDGIRLALVDPYANVKLFVRTQDSDEDKEIKFEDEDMYYTELRVFFDAVRGTSNQGDDDGRIRSPYADALGSYALSWAISEGASK